MGLLLQCDLTYKLIAGGNRSCFLFATVARVERAHRTEQRRRQHEVHDPTMDPTGRAQLTQQQEHRVYSLLNWRPVKFS